MKYTFTLIDAAPDESLCDATGKATRREKLVLESRAGESARHIALKILAYVLFRDATGDDKAALQIERGIGQRHKPDLVATDGETGRILLWIDCGQIETKRLGRIAASNPQTRIVVVKATGREATLYAQAAQRFLPTPEEPPRIRFLGFDDEFLARYLSYQRGANVLAIAPLPRSNDADAPETLRLCVNGELLDTALHWTTG